MSGAKEASSKECENMGKPLQNSTLSKQIESMEYVIDKVTEDSFYENLLLGVPKYLYRKIGIRNTYLSRYEPVNDCEINNWETNYGVPLVKDLRNFYLASNGFLFTWTYSNGGADSDLIMGKIEVNPLFDLIPIYGYETSSEPNVSLVNGRYQIKLTLESKVFELVSLKEAGRIALVYINAKFTPTIWLITSKMKFYFLADDFTTYFRMAIAHIGIPSWQLAFTPKGTPQWSEQLFRLIAPHLLPFNRKVENMQPKIEGTRRVPLNRIDPKIFTHESVDEFGEMQETRVASPGLFNDCKITNPKFRSFMKCNKKTHKLKKF